LRYINPGMAHRSAGRAKFYPLQFTTEPEGKRAAVHGTKHRFYLIVTWIFSETSGGLNG
jgi:hypothetical protein